MLAIAPPMVHGASLFNGMGGIAPVPGRNPEGMICKYNQNRFQPKKMLAIKMPATTAVKSANSPHPIVYLVLRMPTAP
jgi:hypothetical protein